MTVDRTPSKFNHEFFYGGRWWHMFGIEPSYEAPVEIMRARFPTYNEPTFEVDGSQYAVERQNGTAIVRLVLGHGAIESAQEDKSQQQ